MTQGNAGSEWHLGDMERIKTLRKPIGPSPASDAMVTIVPLPCLSIIAWNGVWRCIDVSHDGSHYCAAIPSIGHYLVSKAFTDRLRNVIGRLYAEVGSFPLFERLNG